MKKKSFMKNGIPRLLNYPASRHHMSLLMKLTMGDKLEGKGFRPRERKIKKNKKKLLHQEAGFKIQDDRN